MQREKIGAIWTDVAAIVVGDPCKMIPDERDRAPRITYGQFVEQMSGPRTFPGDPGWEDARDPRDPVFLKGSDGNPCDAVALPTVENCDGWVHLYIERDEKGWPRRLIAELNARSEP
jgi:hypothetical protein